MSTEELNLTLTKRTVVGKQVRSLRRNNIVPAVIYNHGKESTIVEAPLIDLTKIYQAAGKHHPIDLVVDGKKYLAIIKDVNLDPRKNTLRHVVFDSIKQNEKIKTEVPIHFEGDSKAEKAGLMILRQLDVLEIEAVPKNLPSNIVVNIAELSEVGDKIHVSDIAPPEGVRVLTDAEVPVVTVIETPAQQSEDEVADSLDDVESESEPAKESPAESKE